MIYILSEAFHNGSLESGLAQALSVPPECVAEHVHGVPEVREQPDRGGHEVVVQTNRQLALNIPNFVTHRSVVLVESECVLSVSLTWSVPDAVVEAGEPLPRHRHCEDVAAHQHSIFVQGLDTLVSLRVPSRRILRVHPDKLRFVVVISPAAALTQKVALPFHALVLVSAHAKSELNTIDNSDVYDVVHSRVECSSRDNPKETLNI